MITSVVWQKNPEAIASPIENSRSAKDCWIVQLEPRRNSVFFFHKSDTL
jgi:hypothetical protein